MKRITFVRTLALVIVSAALTADAAIAQPLQTPLLTIPKAWRGSYDWPISPKGDLFVKVDSGNLSASVISLKSGKPVAKLNTTSPIFDIYFCPDGKTVAWLNKAGNAVFQDVATGKEKSFPITKADGSKLGLFVFSPDGKYLFAKSFGTLWEIETGKSLGSTSGGSRIDYQSCYFTPDSKTLITTPNITLFDAATSKEKGKLKTAASDSIISPDGKTILLCRPSGAKDNEIVLWDIAGDKEVSRFECDVGKAGAVTLPMAFSPDGKVLAITGPTGTTFIPDPTLSGGKRPVATNSVLFLDFPSGKQIGRLDARTDGIKRLVYAPDGKSLVTLSSDIGVFAVPPLK